MVRSRERREKEASTRFFRYASVNSYSCREESTTPFILKHFSWSSSRQRILSFEARTPAFRLKSTTSRTFFESWRGTRAQLIREAVVPSTMCSTSFDRGRSLLPIRAGFRRLETQQYRDGRCEEEWRSRCLEWSPLWETLVQSNCSLSGDLIYSPCASSLYCWILCRLKLLKTAEH